MYGWLQDDAFLFEDHNITWNGHNWGVDPAKF
jgi:gamma-glutamyl hydrolase